MKNTAIATTFPVWDTVPCHFVVLVLVRVIKRGAGGTPISPTPHSLMAFGRKRYAGSACDKQPHLYSALARVAPSKKVMNRQSRRR